MGIRTGAKNEDVSVGAFSQDILKIEINGPSVSRVSFQTLYHLAKCPG